MAIVQGQTTSFKLQLYEGVHNFLTNTFKMALYTGNASINQDTTVYTTTNEVVGTGYTAGGQTLTGVTINTDPNSSVVYINFNNVIWNPATFITRCALIYNTSASNAAVAVIDFGSDKSCSNTFTVTMPANTSTTALIRSS
jgi:hypothetical protein